MGAQPGTVNEASERILTMLGETTPETSEEPTETETPVEEVTEESVEEEVAAEQEVTEEPDETTEEPSVELLDDLIEAEGYDQEQVMSLKVKAVIDQEESEVSIAELVKNYQMDNAADKRLEDAKSKRDQLAKEVEEHRENLSQQYSRVQSMIAEAEKLVSEEDLTELRETDPAEYAVRMQENREKKEKLEALRNETTAEQNKAVLEVYRKRLVQEREKLLDAIPEWQTDPSEAGLVKDYMKGLGFSDAEIDGQIVNGVLKIPGIVDHRAYVLARKAMLFDQLSNKTAPKKKKMKSLPKVGAGKPKPKADVDKKRQQAKRERLKQTGNIRDAAALIRDRLV